MKKSMLFLVIFSLLLPFGFSQGKKAFTIESLYKVKYPGSHCISPDGGSIAFQVSENDLQKSKRNSDIYLMDLDGKNLRRMTTFEGGDWSPFFSRCGKFIYFFSSRSGDTQLWKIPVAGGEARQVTRLKSNGIHDPLFTPDGKKMVFHTEVFPEFAEDIAATMKAEKSMAEGPVQAHYAKALLHRHWTSYRDGKYSHTMVMDMDTGKIRDLTPGKTDFPMFSLGGPVTALSPDGKEVCIVATTEEHKATTTNGDLFLVNIDGGELRNITSEFKSYDLEPIYSPNGRYIAYKHQETPGYEADRNRLYIYDRRTGLHRGLTESVDFDVASVVWSPDSRQIYYTIEKHGNTPLYRVDIQSEEIRELIPVPKAKTMSGLRITPDGKHIVFARRSIDHATELFITDTGGSKITRLTSFNRALEAEYDVRPAEEMWIPGAEGKKVHTYVIKPHNFDPAKKYPLIINVHGGPQMMWADSFRGDWQVYPGSGYVVAFPNPHGSKGYGQAYCEAISGDWGGRVYEDVLKVAEHLGGLDYVDAEKMGAMGWSYGGYMMMWLQGHPHPFKATVAMMGVYDLESMYGATEELWFPEWDLDGTPWEVPESYIRWSPSSYVESFRTPTLVITGERDYRVPYTQSLQYFTHLQKMGVPSELIVFKNDGHWPDSLKSMPLYYNAHLYWFHRYLGGEKEPYDMDKMIRNQVFGEEKETGKSGKE